MTKTKIIRYRNHEYIVDGFIDFHWNMQRYKLITVV
jgi:hypothetical protein